MGSDVYRGGVAATRAGPQPRPYGAPGASIIAIPPLYIAGPGETTPAPLESPSETLARVGYFANIGHRSGDVSWGWKGLLRRCRNGLHPVCRPSGRPSSLQLDYWFPVDSRPLLRKTL